MSRQQVRGNPRMRKGLGSRTSDPATMMEDPPSGDWLTLRSDQFLNWVDDAVYNIAEQTGIRDVVNRLQVDRDGESVQSAERLGPS